MAGAISFGAGAVEVEGLAEFQTALRELEATVGVQLRTDLLEAGRPVADTAHDLALADISRMKFGHLENPGWSDMRVGQTLGMVYVAPALHRGKTGAQARRRNLATLLVVKAMEPAAEREHGRVEASVERTLNHAFKQVGL